MTDWQNAKEDGNVHNLSQPSLIDPIPLKFQDQLQISALKLPAHSLRVLVCVAHPDDEAIGPGGTLAVLSKNPNVAIFLIVCATSNSQRRAESASFATQLSLPAEQVYLLNMVDGHLKDNKDSLLSFLRTFNAIIQPDLVLTHRYDNHADHRALHRFVREVFARNGISILSFHIPQPFPLPFQPSVWIRISELDAMRKVKEFYSVYKTENWKDYFDTDRALGLMRDAGIAAGSQYAEAFETNNLNLVIDPNCCGLRLRCNPQRVAEDERTVPLLLMEQERLVLEPCRSGCGALVLAQNGSRFKGIS